MFEDGGSGGDDVGLVGEAVHERGPVVNAVIGDALQADVGSRTEQTLLEVLAKSVGDGHGDHERSHAGSDTGDGDAGDDADEGLAAFGAQVAGRDEEFEAHGEVSELSAISYQQVGL